VFFGPTCIEEYTGVHGMEVILHTSTKCFLLQLFVNHFFFFNIW